MEEYINKIDKELYRIFANNVVRQFYYYGTSEPDSDHKSYNDNDELYKALEESNGVISGSFILKCIIEYNWKQMRNKMTWAEVGKEVLWEICNGPLAKIKFMYFENEWNNIDIDFFIPESSRKFPDRKDNIFKNTRIENYIKELSKEDLEIYYNTPTCPLEDLLKTYELKAIIMCPLRESAYDAKHTRNYYSSSDDDNIEKKTIINVRNFLIGNKKKYYKCQIIYTKEDPIDYIMKRFDFDILKNYIYIKNNIPKLVITNHEQVMNHYTEYKPSISGTLDRYNKYVKRQIKFIKTPEMYEKEKKEK